jgi:hypothetical protein
MKGTVGTFAWNLATNTNTWSPELLDVYGLEKTPTVSQWFKMIVPADRNKVAEALDRAIRGDDEYKVSFRVVRNDEQMHVYAKGGLIKVGGKPVALVGINLVR